MRNEMFFANAGLSRFSAYIAESNYIDAPARSVQTVAVPGRSGNLVYESDRFENFVLRARVYVTDRSQSNLSALKGFLNTKRGYQKYCETAFPNEYRLACFRSAFIVDRSDHNGAVMTLEFDCKPQRFLTAGERSITVTSTVKLFNPTEYIARPLIKVTGNGTLTIGDTICTIAATESAVTIDSEIMDCYNGMIPKNDKVSFSTNDFPVLKAGSSVITLGSGITKIEIAPRWWTI